MITIIDYGAGNLSSVDKACKYLGYETEITSDINKILSATKLILPGVGSCGDAMAMLKSSGIANAVKKQIASGTPLLGICLGMQMLFDYSEEGEADCLSMVEGDIKRFPDDMGLKVPQIGWNSITPNKTSRLFEGIEEGSFVYFVHSYYAHCNNQADSAAKAEYGIEFDVAIEKGNLFATQFHPEKSGDTGLKILDNFLKL
ncbi:MAG: imidazole glycerol phosphate synthase subunit HisH [Eubacteriales bacterium]|nr:imidazole glycerol phosphate synthase subunit HisH [Eubacteriales bacterium]